MIKIENTDVVGWGPALRGMRNPKNSWNRADSHPCDCDKAEYGDCPMVMNDHEPAIDCNNGEYGFCIGENDMRLAKTLAEGGPAHAKYRRMIIVYADITAPLYWWKEFDTYKVGTVVNSCSTMHKIHSKPIELSDFSIDDFDLNGEGISLNRMFANVVADCERLRQMYLMYSEKAKKTDRYSQAEIKHFKQVAKFAWKGLIQLLPTSYNQKRTVMLNYEVLANICEYRSGHKLDEWRDFCVWIESLPYRELITGKE